MGGDYMKRIINFALVLLMLFMLCSCSKIVNNLTGTNSGGSLKDYSEFISIFKEKIEKLNDSGSIGYEIFELEIVELEDDIVYHPFVIKDNVDPIDIDNDVYSGTYDFEQTFHLGVYCNENKEITQIRFFTDRNDYLQFSVFSLYVYEAMGYSVTSADDFYDKFDFWSKEDIFETSNEEGYDITCFSGDKYINFNITAK